MIFPKSSLQMPNEWQNCQHCDGDHGEQAAGVGNPFTEAQAEMRDES